MHENLSLGLLNSPPLFSRYARRCAIRMRATVSGFSPTPSSQAACSCDKPYSPFGVWTFARLQRIAPSINGAADSSRMYPKLDRGFAHGQYFIKQIAHSPTLSSHYRMFNTSFKPIKPINRSRSSLRRADRLTGLIGFTVVLLGDFQFVAHHSAASCPVLLVGQ